jgi:hypothetical protein
MNEVIQWVMRNSKGFNSVKKGQPVSKTELTRMVELT